MLTMATASIREATAADIGAIQVVIADANLPFRGTVPDSFFDSYLSSALDVSGRLRDGEVLVATVDHRVVGTITYFREANEELIPVTFPSGTAGIRATAVDPAVRGQGIGRLLVDACVDRARAAGATDIGLRTASFMTTAVRLYERAGFRRVPEFDFPTSAFFPSRPGEDLLAIAYLRGVGR